MTKQDRIEFREYCRGVTDKQLMNVLAKEKLARRTAYAKIAAEEVVRRALT